MLSKIAKSARIIIFIVIISFFVSYAVPASAQIIFNNPSSINTTQDLVASVVNWILGIAAAVVIIFLIIGGIYYMTAAGDEKQIEEAKRIIKYCIIGLFAILISYSVVTTLNKIIFG